MNKTRKNNKLRSCIEKQSTMRLFGIITLIILIYFFLLLFAAFMYGRAKYIYIGVVFELISLTSSAYGIVTIARNEIPMGVYSIKGIVAIIGGVIAILISFFGMYSFLTRLVYWISK